MFPHINAMSKRLIQVNGRFQRVTASPVQNRVTVHRRRTPFHISRKLHIRALLTVTSQRERMGHQRSRDHRLTSHTNSKATSSRVNTNRHRVSTFRVKDRAMVTVQGIIKTGLTRRILSNTCQRRKARFIIFTLANRVGRLNIHGRVLNKDNRDPIRIRHARKSTNSSRRQAIQVSTGLHHNNFADNNAIVFRVKHRSYSYQAGQRTRTFSFSTPT